MPSGLSNSKTCQLNAWVIMNDLSSQGIEQCYDDVNVMLGNMHWVQTTIHKEVSNVAYVHCRAQIEYSAHETVSDFLALCRPFIILLEIAMSGICGSLRFRPQFTSKANSEESMEDGWRCWYSLLLCFSVSIESLTYGLSEQLHTSDIVIITAATLIENTKHQM